MEHLQATSEADPGARGLVLDHSCYPSPQTRPLPGAQALDIFNFPLRVADGHVGLWAHRGDERFPVNGSQLVGSGCRLSAVLGGST